MKFHALVAMLLVLQLMLEIPTTEATKRRYPLFRRGLFFKKSFQYHYQPVVPPYLITPRPSFENALNDGIAGEVSSEEEGVSSEEKDTSGFQESSSEEMVGSVLRPPSNPVLQRHFSKSLNLPRRIEQKTHH